MKKVDYFKFFIIYKNGWNNLLSKRKKNREILLNRAKDYYENNKEVLREKAKNKSRELPSEENNIKREYGRNRYKNMSDENKEY